jgi:SAM-dependent methyltransferase
MLGRYIAPAYNPPRRWILRVWGIPDIAARQKWSEVWPILAKLPLNGLRVLDAGCGCGTWTMELAARRPGWSIVGIDCDATFLRAAEATKARLGLGNVSFVHTDFLSFRPPMTYDVVLSILSAHYLASAGRGADLFKRFRQWLADDGVLVLLGPRKKANSPFVSFLPRPEWHDVFSDIELDSLCRESALRINVLRPTIGLLGTTAKQFALSRLGRATYPVQVILTGIDRLFGIENSRASLMWLLVATPLDRGMA